MPASKILVVDDDPDILFSVRDFLERRGYAVEEAETLEEARVRLVQTRPDAMVLDHVLPDGTAVDEIDELLRLDPEVVILVLTGYGSIELAVEAIKKGADQFLTKPIEMPALEEVLERCLENRRLRRRQAARERAEPGQLDPFLGDSAAIRGLREEALRSLGTTSPILIQGETGSGKGVLARWLHRHGQRANESFVDLNCAGLSKELLDSELFGHARGAFTGAVSDKEGLLEIAHKGVLFLDEVGDMDLAIQAKLLKVLEEGTFRRLGETRERRSDVQLYAATHHDLARSHREGSFRPDLYYRISTVPLRVPPLRERGEDLEALARDLLARLAAELKRGEVELAPAAVARLREHSWPGNIRELRNVLERAVLAAEGKVLDPEHLRFDPAPVPDRAAGGEGTLEEMEAAEIRRALAAERGRVTAAAERLGVPRSTFYVKLKTYGIDPEDFRS